MVIELSLCCPHLRRLRLDGSSLLSDPGVAAVASNCPLRELSVIMCPKLSSRSLYHLAGCTSLTALSVSLNKKVTAEARRDFMRRRPDVSFPALDWG